MGRPTVRAPSGTVRVRPGVGVAKGFGYATSIVIGVAVCWCMRHQVQFPDEQRYAFGYRRGVPTPAQVAAIRQFFLPAIYFTGGCLLIFGAAAGVARRLAVSRFGIRAGHAAVLAVNISALFGLITVIAILLSAEYPSDPSHGGGKIIATIAASAAVITTCSMILMALSVPTALWLIFLQALAARRSRTAKDSEPWWQNCLAEPELPTLDESESVQEWSWVNSYNVPGAGDVIERRRRHDEPVQAICLSGGGVRSACVAMGVLQELSMARPLVDLRRGDDSASAAADEEKLIDNVDYIVSVSGGGYTAGARLLVSQNVPGEKQLSGTASTGTPRSDRSAGRPLRLSERFEEGSVEFEHLRRHSSYIADSTPTLLTAFAEVLKNLLASMVTLFWPSVTIGFTTGYFLAALPVAAIVPVSPHIAGGAQIPEETVRETKDFLPSLAHNQAAWWAMALFGVIGIVAMVAALLVERASYSPTAERWRSRLTGVGRTCLIVTAWIATVTFAAPLLMLACSHQLPANYSSSGIISGLLGAQYLTAIVAMVWRRRSTVTAAGSGSWRDKLPHGLVPTLLATLVLTAVTVTWLVILGASAAGVFTLLTQHVGGPLNQPALLWVSVGCLILLAGLLSMVDVTSLSLHPFYRARLALAFAIRRQLRNLTSGATAVEAEAYSPDEPTWLHTHGRVEGGPQFVFAAAAAISGEGKPAPGLNAVSYALGASHIGGPNLGWLKTAEIWKACPPRIKHDLTVQAAVAISGAAFGSTMGRQNKGLQTLYAISGARLGTWLPNPNYVALLADKTTQQEHPRRSVTEQSAEAATPSGELSAAAPGHDNVEPAPPLRQPTDALTMENGDSETSNSRPPALLRSLPTVRGFNYFFRELLGRHPIDASLVQVTDGGHYENLGLVEALRRRSQFIICIDGGGDKPPLLSGLADALRLASAELGVTVTFDGAEPHRLADLAPGSGNEFPASNAFAALNHRITKAVVAEGTIKYPPAAGLPTEMRTGTLLFAKAVLWDQSPDWLLTYAASSEEFPHDSTADQWFDEAQFGAYTELGRLIGLEVIRAIQRSKPVSEQQSGGSEPAFPIATTAAQLP